MTGDEDGTPVRGADGIAEALRPTAARVRRVLGTGQMRPAFRDRLRREVVTARHAAIAAGTTRRGRPSRAVRHRRRPVLEWAGVAAAVAAAATVLVVYGPPFPGNPGPVRVSVLSNVNGSVSNDLSTALRLTFSQPLDHRTAASAVRLSPATKVRSAWDGDTLTLTPVYGFAPNSAYVLTVDHTIALTARGAPLAADIHVLFGTASVAGPGSPGNTALAAPALVPTPVADAGDRSQAVAARDGSLLLSAARPGPGTGGLVRIHDGTATALSAAVEAICVSRSGQSVAYLSRDATGTRIVFADGVGAPSSSVTVQADPGSPLGWINDAEVTFVGSGRLRAVDRAGQVRTLSDEPVDAGRDTVVPAPGGRYVYLRPASGGTGRIVDVPDHTAHAVPGGTGDVAFSADGATVAWFAGSGGGTVLELAPSGGGPVLTVRLPVVPGDRLSGLALSPDSYHFVYSVTAADHDGELRLAALPDGRTVAVAGGTVGRSPNWSASGRLLTVLTGPAGGAHLDAVPVPDAGTGRPAALQALAMAFARAQVGADAGAQRALAARDAALPTLPGISRAAVLWLVPGANGTATARLRLTIDASPDQPVARQAEERLTLGPRPSDGTFAVLGVSVEQFRPAPGAPQVIRCDTDTSPGSVLLTFDSDLDPATVPAAIGLRTTGGQTVPGTASYDAASRTVTVRPDAAADSVVVRVDTGLRDVRGQQPVADLRIPVDLGG
jgi:Big-like domain-containing protein